MSIASLRFGSPRGSRRLSRRGAMMILVVILLPVLFLLAAMAINIAYVQLVRTELQISTDIAGRAAGRAFVLTGDKDAAYKAAQQVLARNTVAGQPLPIAKSDLEFGLAERPSLADRYSFTIASNPNAVRLTTNSFFAAGGVQPFLPGFGPGVPLRPIRSAIVTQVEIDIALVIDRSGSMAYAADEAAVYPPEPAAAPKKWKFGKAVPPNARWLDTIAAVRVFLQELDKSPQLEHVALATYNHDTALDVDATTQYQAIIDALDVYSAAFNSGGTAIGNGIHRGLEAFDNTTATRPWASKVIIVMTDGMQNYGDWPTDAASYAAEQGAMVFTVTFSNEADQPLMADTAAEGGGRHYHAVDAAQLRAAFADIARQLPSLLTR